MSSKRNRRGHRLIRRLAQSHTASGGDKHTFIFWKYHNELCFRHFLTMCMGLDYGHETRERQVFTFDNEVNGSDRRPVVMYTNPNSRDDHLHRKFIDQPL